MEIHYNRLTIDHLSKVRSLTVLFGEEAMKTSTSPKTCPRQKPPPPPTMTPMRSGITLGEVKQSDKNPLSMAAKNRQTRKTKKRFLDLSISPNSCRSSFVTPPKRSVVSKRKSPFSVRSQKNIDQCTRTNSSSKSKFITPKRLKFEQKSPRLSSEAPTVVVRLSSCLTSSITPQMRSSSLKDSQFNDVRS